MTGFRASWLVARRELRERSKGRTYRITTLILMVVVVAAIVLPAVIDGDDGVTYDLGVVGTIDSDYLPTLEVLAGAVEVEISITEFSSVVEGESAVSDGEIDGLLVDGRQVVVREAGSSVFYVSGGAGLVGLLSGAAQTLELQEIVVEAGVSAEELATTLTGEPIEVRGLEPEDPNRLANEIASVASLFLLYFAILSYGAWTLNGVIEEKSNRIVEVLMSALRPHHLLAGKVAGIGLLGLLQLALVSGSALVAALAVDLFDLPQLTLSVLGSLILWFVLGFSFYAVAYAGLGALVSRMEDAQSVATPLTLVGVVGYILAFQTLEHPDGLLATITTFIPATAPFVVPIRTVQSAISWWELIAAVVMMGAAIYGMIRLAGRLYVGGILHIGQRMKVREAWRSAE
ncbi:MAG TPA: ABC transporter permease [Acidimicrobiia bacterium]|nr:ABC transporter permease [Acidimicrobiia bacterium]